MLTRTGNQGRPDVIDSKSSQTEERGVVRLSVNLAADVAAVLKTLTKQQGISITEGIRRAIALWKVISDEHEKGHRIMVVDGEGPSAKYRELIFL